MHRAKLVVLYAKHRRAMQLQSILRQIHPIPGFVYGSIALRGRGQRRAFYVRLRARSGSRPVCGSCGKKGREYDTLKERQSDFVPLWAIPVVFLYAMRRVDCFSLKQDYRHFWEYKAPWAAKAFLVQWTKLAMRSKLEPMKRFARTVRQHEPELLNWFNARGRFALGATEGFNKARITTRKAYGFRTYEHARIALYHALGDLPVPDWLTHGFV